VDATVYKTCDEAANSGVKFDYGRSPFSFPPSGLSHIDASSAVQLTVLCSNKALLDAKPSLSETIRPVMTDTTSIVLLQNGVGAEEPLHESFPENTIISAVVWTGAKVLAQGHVEQFNREALTIGVDWNEKLGKGNEEEQKRLDRLVKVLKAGGGDCNVVDDIQSERWVKVIW
jgi:2-dehydropantoate 2-reductase